MYLVSEKFSHFQYDGPVTERKIKLDYGTYPVFSG